MSDEHNGLERAEAIELEAAPRAQSFAWSVWMLQHLHGAAGDSAPEILDRGRCDQCDTMSETRFAFGALALCHTCLTSRQRVAQVAA